MRPPDIVRPVNRANGDEPPSRVTGLRGTIKTSHSKWREQYKVHPAADVFPMMSDQELAELGKDIKANRLGHQIVVSKDGTTVLDGRNRLEAMERAGIPLNPALHVRHYGHGDPTTFIISANIHRRHLTKQQRADLIVAAVKAAETARAARKADKYIGRDGGPPDKPRQVGEVSDLDGGA